MHLRVKSRQQFSQGQQILANCNNPWLTSSKRSKQLKPPKNSCPWNTCYAASQNTFFTHTFFYWGINKHGQILLTQQPNVFILLCSAWSQNRNFFVLVNSNQNVDTIANKKIFFFIPFQLIQFLVTMVQPNRSGLGGMSNGAGLKRRFQLMINDVPRSSKVWLEDVVNTLVLKQFFQCECEIDSVLRDNIFFCSSLVTPPSLP